MQNMSSRAVISEFIIPINTVMTWKLSIKISLRIKTSHSWVEQWVRDLFLSRPFFQTSRVDFEQVPSILNTKETVLSNSWVAQPTPEWERVFFNIYFDSQEVKINTRRHCYITCGKLLNQNRREGNYRNFSLKRLPTQFVVNFQPNFPPKRWGGGNNRYI